MLVAVVYERQIHSHIDCYKSLDGFSAPIRVTGCCLSPLGCNRQYFSIQGGHQSCWCKLLMHCILNVDIFHQGYLWCLTYISYWWRCCMLIYFQEGTNFNKYRLLLKQPGWYISYTLCWRFVCCARTIIGFYQWWVTSSRIFVMRSGKSLVQEMGGHTIPRWGWPSWDCMMHPQH